MIDLTPLDVRKKKEDFRRSVRGYDSAQVDGFLDVVADRLEALVREHASLSERVEHLAESLKSYQERERALNEALLAAQELREEARSQAERDAAVRLREAETHAEAILLDADQAIRHSTRRLEDLRARRRQFLKNFRTLVERYAEYIELEETRLETEPEDLGDLLERLQTDLAEEGTTYAGGRGADPADARRVTPAADATGHPYEASADAHVDREETGDGSSTSPASGPAPNAAGNGHAGMAGPDLADPGALDVPVSDAQDGPADPDRRTSRLGAPTEITPADSGGPSEAASN